MPETLRSSGSVSVAVAISRVLGLVRMSLFSRLLGAGALADAYSVAFRIPNLLRDLLAEGALSSAFVPTFTAALVQDDRRAAYELGNLIFSAILVITGLLSALGIIFAEEVVLAITDGWSAEKVAQTALLTRVMMPILALVSLGAVWMGMLNAQKRYREPALAPAVFNVVSIVAGLGIWLAGASGGDAVLVWSLGTLAAGIAQTFVQLPVLWRLGYRPQLRLRGLRAHPGVRRIVRLMLPALVGVAAVQLNVFINTRFAASLGDGPVAQIEYAFRVFFLPIGIFGVALATVTATRVSEDAARGDLAGLAARAAEGLSAVWLLSSASAVGLVLLAEPVISLLYEGGRFSASDTAAVAMILQAYMVGLVPYSMVKVVAPTFYSLDQPRIPLIASVSAVAVNLTFNALTYRTLGAPGLALGTSLAAIVNLTILRVAFRRLVGPRASGGRGREGLALLVANGVMAAVIALLWALSERGIAFVQEAAPALAGGLRAVALALVIGAAFAVYAVILRRFAYPGADLLVTLPRRIVGRLRRR
ncbi:MAG: murein biosynthesis integral membrane protein MurJ [Myxococcales bacterium]|nr:murein biosynthesis integral membrane protein MurJ [Myxococcales bacterium]MCB9705672.1 murein biosynthesis integral membrane protein MurJ [Myxococcales bacterium]